MATIILKNDSGGVFTTSHVISSYRTMAKRREPRLTAAAVERLLHSILGLCVPRGCWFIGGRLGSLKMDFSSFSVHFVFSVQFF